MCAHSLAKILLIHLLDGEILSHNESLAEYIILFISSVFTTSIKNKQIIHQEVKQTLFLGHPQAA